MAAEDAARPRLVGVLRGTDRLGRRSFMVSLNTRPRRRGTKSRFPRATPRPPQIPLPNNVPVLGVLSGETFDGDNIGNTPQICLESQIFYGGVLVTALRVSCLMRRLGQTPCHNRPAFGLWQASRHHDRLAPSHGHSAGRSRPSGFRLNASRTNSPRPRPAPARPPHLSFRFHSRLADCWRPRPLRGRHSAFGRLCLNRLRDCGHSSTPPICQNPVHA